MQEYFFDYRKCQPISPVITTAMVIIQHSIDGIADPIYRINYKEMIFRKNEIQAEFKELIAHSLKHLFTASNYATRSMILRK